MYTECVAKMSHCKHPALILTTSLLLLLLFGASFTQAFVTTGPRSASSSSSLSSGSSMGPTVPTTTTTTSKNGGTIGATAADSNDDSDDEDDDEVDDFSRMMQGVQAAASPGGQTVYVIEFESEADKANGHHNRGGKDMSDDGSDGQSPLDPWSIVWYIGSFGGLIAFFLIVSCSEWCCRRGARPLNIPYTQRGEVINATATGSSNQTIVTESPPPPYHLFAPPPYDSVNYAEIADKSSPPAAVAGEKLDIYVISLPIQAAPAQPPPA